ncbi:MAG: hypothetical protein LPH19_15315 [Shewanella sp.]|nr:hypothetical protein [Shewanella sp.]
MKGQQTLNIQLLIQTHFKVTVCETQCLLEDLNAHTSAFLIDSNPSRYRAPLWLMGKFEFKIFSCSKAGCLSKLNTKEIVIARKPKGRG